jgi:hypothetical protein
MSGPSTPLSAGLSPIPTHPPSRPTPPAEDSDLPIHRLVGPDDGLCACGRPREACVRDAVRALWTPETPADDVGQGLPGRHPASENSRSTGVGYEDRQDPAVTVGSSANVRGASRS